MEQSANLMGFLSDNSTSLYRAEAAMGFIEPSLLEAFVVCLYTRITWNFAQL